MSDAGLSSANALLLAVAAWVLVVLCYRLRDRRRRFIVAYLPLWQALSVGSRAARLRERLRFWGSLALQLLVVALLALALLDPNITFGARQPRHQLVLVDTSASMLTNEGGLTRWELLRPKVLEFLRALDGSTKVLLALADSRMTPLLPWTQDQQALLRAVEGIQPVESALDVDVCLASAASYLSGKSHPAILLATDATRADWQAFKPPPQLASVPVQVILAGSTAYNLGILAFTARERSDSARTIELLIELVNDDDRDHDVAIEFTSADRLPRLESTRVKAGLRKKLSLTDVSQSGHTVTAQLRILDGPPDALRFDDVAHAVLPAVQKTRVAIVSPGNLYLEAAVLSDELLQPELIAPGSQFDARSFDAAIYHDVSPSLPLTLPTFLLDPPPDNPLIVTKPGLESVGFDRWDAQHPILKGLDLYDAQIDRGKQLILGAGDRGLASAGTKTILATGTRDQQPWVALGFDPADSDFVLRPSWPLFVRQVLVELMGRSIAEVRAARPNAVVRLPAPAVSVPGTLLGPSGSSRRVQALGPEYTFVPGSVGLYRVAFGPRSAFVAVNLSSESESRIAPMRPFRIGERELSPYEPRASKPRRPRFVQFAAAVLALLLFEWISFHRRWSV